MFWDKGDRYGYEYKIVEVNEMYIISSMETQETLGIINPSTREYFYNYKGKELLKVVKRIVSVSGYFPESLSQSELIERPTKYLDPIEKNIIKEITIKKYPAVISRKVIAGKRFEIRTRHLPYEPNSGENIVVLNDNFQIVAAAQDEWGATLLVVASEYRGLGLGRILGKIWYNDNPRYMSGGFTSYGQKNAIRIWQDRVREFLTNGWYSLFVREGKITQDKVKAILSDSKREGGKPIQKIGNIESPSVIEKPIPLLYIDDNISFIIYDFKYLDNQEERFIYAYGFLRDFNDETFIYRIDYEPEYKEIAYTTMVYMAASTKDKIKINTDPSDLLEIKGNPNIKIEGDYIVPAIPISSFKFFSESMSRAIKKEKMVRKMVDPYKEKEYKLIEDAEGKW
jgi:hypothetical protein